MRTHLSILPVLATLAIRLPAQVPALDGAWVAAPGETPASLPAAPSAILGPRFGLRLERTHVTLTRAASDGSAMVSTIPLDGTMSRTPAPGPLCMGERIYHETASLQGTTLVIAIDSISPPGSVAAAASGVRYLIRSEGEGRLVVESSITQRGERRQVGAVYRRSGEPLPPPRPALPTAGTPATIDQVGWIGTMWVGAAGTMTVEERWTPPASGAMIGVGRTLRGQTMSGYEQLCIAERNGTLVYFAMPNGRMPATPFVATEVSPTHVTFSNPSHDYPQVIRYSQTPDGGLETMISASDGSRATRFTLKKGTQ